MQEVASPATPRPGRLPPATRRAAPLTAGLLDHFAVFTDWSNAPDRGGWGGSRPTRTLPLTARQRAWSRPPGASPSVTSGDRATGWLQPHTHALRGGEAEGRNRAPPAQARWLQHQAVPPALGASRRALCPVATRRKRRGGRSRVRSSPQVRARRPRPRTPLA